MRLPDGSPAKDWEDYTNAWNTLTADLEQALPLWQVVGNDPGISLHSKESKTTLRLDVPTAKWLIELWKGQK